MEQNDEELLALMLRAQSTMVTHAEVISLLAHDLGHRAIHVSETVEHLIQLANKALREGNKPESLAAAAEEARSVCAELERQIGMIRRARVAPDDKIVRFHLLDSLKQVVQTFGSAFGRNNMEVDLQIPSSIECHGVPSVLQQVFLNLVLNSLDAQRSAARQRKNVVHIVATKIETPRQRVVVKFWDEGPGISYKAFPNANDIFVVGRSSKPEGTGTGLPVARSLLDRYFGGDITLKDRARALFEISIPLRTE